MNNKSDQKLVDQVRTLSGDTILAVARRCNGHMIFKPEAFLKCGLPREVVDHFTRLHQSDGSPKGTLFVDGKSAEELTGVYGLHVLRFLADALGVEYRRAMGRGSEARNIRVALHKHFDAATTASS